MGPLFAAVQQAAAVPPGSGDRAAIVAILLAALGSLYKTHTEARLNEKHRHDCATGFELMRKDLRHSAEELAKRLAAIERKSDLPPRRPR